MPLHGINSGESFVAMLERAQASGNFKCVEANVPHLRQLIARLVDEAHASAKLQQRALGFLERHG